MKRRVQVGTDIARIGIWDESVDAVPSSEPSLADIEKLLVEETERGRLFLIQLGGDWGGTLDVYVDGALEPGLQDTMTAISGEFLFRSPSGRIVVGGAEDFGSLQKNITSETSIVPVRPGEYALKCYKRDVSDDDEPDIPGPEEIEAAVGSDLYAYYRRSNRRALKGFWFLLLIFPVTYWFGWVAGIVVTVAVVVAFFHGVEWLQRQDEKYLEAEAAVEAAIANGQALMPPMLAIELRRIEQGHGLSGGRVEI